MNTGAFIIVEDDVDPQTAKTVNSGEGFDNYTPTDGFDGQIPDDGFDGQTPDEDFDNYTPTDGFDGQIPGTNVDGQIPGGGVVGQQNSSNSRIHNSFINAGRGNDIILAGQGRDEIEGGDDFIDGGSESDFLSKFVDATPVASNIKLEDPGTGTSGVYSIYADEDDFGEDIYWAWDDDDNPSYFEVVDNQGEFGIKLAEENMDFMQFTNDRFNSYDVAYYNGSQVRYDISEVYLKIDSGRPDLKSDGSYQVMSVDDYAGAG